MKRSLITLTILFVFSSCAHHHAKPVHHHHKAKSDHKAHGKSEMFDKHCALSVAEGDLHVKGNDDFKFEHGGKSYYFSSMEKMELFKKDLKKNKKASQRNWDRGPRQ